MRDSLGNKLSAGQYVYWKSKDLVMQVVNVIEPKIEVMGQPKQPPAVVLQLVIPVNLDRQAGRMEDIGLADFMRVVDPASETALESILAGGKPQ